MEFTIKIFQAWKVSGIRPLCRKVMEDDTKWLPHFRPVYMLLAFAYITIIVYCQTELHLFSIIMSLPDTVVQD